MAVSALNFHGLLRALLSQRPQPLVMGIGKDAASGLGAA